MVELLGQWDCLLKNLGQWHGSFTRLSPKGELLSDTPTVVSLMGLNHNQTVRQEIHRFPLGEPPQQQVLEYQSLARSVLFFDNGAFSQGSIQWGPFAEFGAELGLIEGDRRLRLVQLFQGDGHLQQLTLIREKREGSVTPDRCDLSVDQLFGEWIGEAVTIYPDWRSPQVYSTCLKVEPLNSQQILQQLVFGTTAITSTAILQDNRLYFDHQDSKVQLLMLPDGASSACPVQIKPGSAFFLEVGWLLQPDWRHRLIRRYDQTGAWVSLTLLKERKLSY